MTTLELALLLICAVAALVMVGIVYIEDRR